MSALTANDDARLARAIAMLRTSHEHPFDAQVIDELAFAAGSTGFLTAGHFKERAMLNLISILLRWLRYLGLLNTPSGADPVPDAPVVTACFHSGENLYNLEWTNGGATQTAVQVWLNTNGAGYIMVATLGAADFFYAASVPNPPGDVVCGKVRAVNGSSASSFSNECCSAFI